MCMVNWNNLIEIIDNNIGVKSNWVCQEINDVTSVFAVNCFNCMSGENLTKADYWVLTRCEDPTSIKSWLNNSSGSEACEKFSSYI